MLVTPALHVKTVLIIAGKQSYFIMMLGNLAMY